MEPVEIFLKGIFMNKQISLQQISNFSKEYNKNTENKLIENKVTQQGIEKACLNFDIIKENPTILMKM